jgi:hypothetical protein
VEQLATVVSRAYSDRFCIQNNMHTSYKMKFWHESMSPLDRKSLSSTVAGHRHQYLEMPFFIK